MLFRAQLSSVNLKECWRGGCSALHAGSPTLLIVAVACGNGASDFNVVIYVMCLEQCVLGCISSQKGTHQPHSAFVREGGKSLLAYDPAREL